MLVSLSTVTQLKVRPAISASIACKVDASTAASVVRKPSIVAMFGAIMPLPLHIPPTRTLPSGSCTSTAISLGRVSVVMIANAAPGPPSGRSSETAAGSAASIFSTGSSCPITPVEQTSTSCGDSPSAAAAAACIRSAFSRSRGAQQLAFPALMITARAAPRATTCRLSRTGAAFTSLVVNTPATFAGTSETSSARSGFPLTFRPQQTPEAR